MQIRSAIPADLDRLADIDGTIDSPDYLHVERSGEGLGIAWRLEERRLRERLIDSNRVDDESRYLLKQIAIGVEEGMALVAEHEDALVASLAAHVQPANRTLRIADLRVDYDFRRQGLGLAMVYQVVHEARQRELRAVTAATRTNNLPAGRLLLKAGFDLAGLDLRLHSNHDLVKEAVALFWYAALD
jgi:ribosomal protein S18 acetylase RimI-like enzyme